MTTAQKCDAWLLRTKIHRQLPVLALSAAAAYLLSGLLQTDSHPWKWWLGLASFTVCLGLSTLFGYLVARTLLGVLLAPLRRLNWQRIAGASFILGGLAVIIGLTRKTLDENVFWASWNITAAILVGLSFLYFVVLASKSGMHPLEGTRYAKAER